MLLDAQEPPTPPQPPQGGPGAPGPAGAAPPGAGGPQGPPQGGLDAHPDWHTGSKVMQRSEDL